MFFTNKVGLLYQINFVRCKIINVKVCMKNWLLTVPAIIWLILSALFFAGGEFLSKKWGMKPGLVITLLIIFTYALGTVTWLPALLYKNQLAVMGTLWLLLATMATMLIGVLVYHESLTTAQ